MGRRVSAVPGRFQQEPIDVRSYDRWQDAEGLLDAADGCREAWMAFREAWKGARDADLGRGLGGEPDEGAWPPTSNLGLVTAVALARDLGSRFGLCAARQSRRPLTTARREAWWRWRSRVIRHDPDVWWALWGMVDGQALGLLAARHGRSAGHLQRQVEVALGWLSAEMGYGPLRLHHQDVRYPRHRVEGHSDALRSPCVPSAVAG